MALAKIAPMPAPDPLPMPRSARKPPADAPASNSPRGSGEAEARIHSAIFEAVMDRRLVPGTRLPEAALAKLYKVSRATVRKALQMLVVDHIVSLRPNQSAIVAVPTPEETRAVFEARRAVESAIVALAVERHVARDIARLRERL
ncbi:MAG: GntR family transcriptional regulator, partial [Azoarcus sp.]|nr:GntR family transcriptional regulator [Azoarcus sp.]